MISIYTDGACSGNPGPGGWAALILQNERQTALSGGEAATTNNRMELKAVIMALTQVAGDGGAGAPGTGARIALYTDSQYVQKGITQWIKRWRANGWKTAGKEEVKNRDLWQELEELSARLSVEWHWVKGHANNQYNLECDRLARREIDKLRATSA